MTGAVRPDRRAKTITETFDHVLARDPGRVALVGTTRSLSYGDLDAAADAAAAALAAFGVGAGDRVAVSLPNDVDIVIAFHGVMRLGAIWVGLDRALAAPEKEVLLRAAEPALVLADRETAATVAPGRRTVRVDPADPAAEWGSALDASTGAPRRAPPAPDVPAAIAFTSGTTGVPKGIVHSQHNLLLPPAAIVVTRRYDETLRKGDSLALTILNLQVLTSLLTSAAGGCCVLTGRRDVQGIAEWIARERVNVWNGVPALLHSMAHDPDIDPALLQGMREVWTGGAGCPEDVIAAFQARFEVPVHQAYGLTEAPTVVTIDPVDRAHRESGSGVALPYLDVVVCDDAGCPLAPGQEGEIVFRAAGDGEWRGAYTPMLGLWRDGSVDAFEGADLWTGDIGSLGADGTLYVRDRKKLLILRGGANVYPADVERVLDRAPGVRASAVFGIPDARLGQRVAAAIEVDVGTFGGIPDVERYCREHLAGYKVPEQIIVVDVLPRNAMGKVQRAPLVDLVAARAATDRGGEIRTLTFDVMVVGAGFVGLYALHTLRGLGFSVRVLETGDGVGGTWYWNRYPGARCDVESIEYAYSFSKEIEQEWVWSDVMPAQAEVERYLNFVADRLDLRRDIQLGTKVVAMTYDEMDASWTVETDGGEVFRAPFVVAATGILSTPLEPDIPGRETFAGITLSTNRFPKEGFDFTGKRVAVIGTGSSGVQTVPVVAAQALHLTVFQRSAAYTVPSSARPFAPGELEGLKARYDEIRAEQRTSRAGATRLGAFAVLNQAATRPPIKEASREEQLGAIDESGVVGALCWSDVATDMAANAMARRLYGEAIARVVHDPETAASLVPTYPFGCKRPIIDVGYFETFNRDNVTLVDLRKNGIERITPRGIQCADGFFELDVIVYATGFDAMTGALSRIEVRGRGGQLLRDAWAAEGPVSYLGLQVSGFPNLFTITGPASPSALSNVVASIEQHVDWVAACLVHLREHGYRRIEATPEAQATWCAHSAGVAEGTVFTDPGCASWYLGANVPGKPRVFMAYVGGLPDYRQRCDEVVAAGYAGFALA